MFALALRFMPEAPLLFVIVVFRLRELDALTQRSNKLRFARQVFRVVGFPLFQDRRERAMALAVPRLRLRFRELASKVLVDKVAPLRAYGLAHIAPLPAIQF